MTFSVVKFPRQNPNWKCFMHINRKTFITGCTILVQYSACIYLYVFLSQSIKPNSQAFSAHKSPNFINNAKRILHELLRPSFTVLCITHSRAKPPGNTRHLNDSFKSLSILKIKKRKRKEF